MVVVGPFEQTDSAGGRSACTGIHLAAVWIAHREQRRCGRHGPTPLQGGAICIESYIRFAGLTGWMTIAAGFVAAGPAGVFIGQPKGGMPHFMDGDFIGATGQGEGAHRSAAAAIHRGIHHH